MGVGRNAIIKINYFREMKQDCTLLLASTAQKVTLLLNGFIPVATLTCGHLGLASPRFLQSHYDGSVYSIVAEESGQKNTLWLVEH